MLPLEGAQRRRGLEAHDPVDRTWFVTEAPECLLRKRHLSPVPRRRVCRRSIGAGRHLQCFYVLPTLAGHCIEEDANAQQEKRRPARRRSGGTDVTCASQAACHRLRAEPMTTATPPASARPPRIGDSGIVFCRSAVALMEPRSTIVSRLV